MKIFVQNMWFFLLLFSLCFVNCKKDCLDEYESINFEKVDIGCCFYNDTSYIINDDSTYQSHLSSLNTNLPEIDFSQNTLIGKFMEGQCKQECYKVKDVGMNADKKMILLCINHKTGSLLKCGCKSEFSTMNWLTIPKIQTEFDITIHIE